MSRRRDSPRPSAATRTLVAWPELRAQVVISAVPDVRVSAASRMTSADVRVDTPSLDLARAGVTLRRVRDGGVSEAAPARWDVSVVPSPLWHPDCGSDVRWWQEPLTAEPPGALVGLLRGIGGDELVEVERRTQRWQVVRPVARGDDVSATVELDHVTVGSADPEATVRLVGEARLVRDLARAFHDAGAVERDRTEAVDALVGRRVPAVFVPPELPDAPTAGDVVRRTLAQSVERLLHNDLAIRLRLGPEGVHQARVATRRLRSDLRTFRGLVDPEWAAELSAELRWLADLLGQVRDADVQLGRLRRRVAALGAHDGSIGLVLVQRMLDQRDEAARELDEVMTSAPYVQLLGRLVSAVAMPRLLAEAEAPAVAALDAIAARAWRPLATAARTAVRDGVDAPIDEVHAVRIKAKRFRYAADAAAQVEPAAAKHAKWVGRLQDELGELNDAAVAIDWLRAQVGSSAPELACVIGRLIEREAAEIAVRRRTWMGVWAKAAQPSRRAWLADAGPTQPT